MTSGRPITAEMGNPLEMPLPQQIEQYAGIKVARARSHHEAAGRRQPHAGGCLQHLSCHLPFRPPRSDLFLQRQEDLVKALRGLGYPIYLDTVFDPPGFEEQLG